jgi:hypothetical protein
MGHDEGQPRSDVDPIDSLGRDRRPEPIVIGSRSQNSRSLSGTKCWSADPTPGSSSPPTNNA